MDAAPSDKHYFRIGEVATLLGLPASVLRYWETEFGPLKPRKSSSGQRLYTKKDLELIEEIKRLLYAEKLTIEGARRRIDLKRRAPQPAQVDPGLTAILHEVREELRDLRDLL